MDENDNEFKRLYKRSQIYIVPQILESQAKFLKEESKTNEDGEKDDEDKRLAPCAKVDFQKLRNCQDRWRGENAEYQVLTKMFYLLQKETTGTSSPGFIFHNKKFEKNRTKQEADIIVVHVALGICILEVKAMEKFKPDYVTKGLKQLMDLRECLSDEMENLVQKSSISIHLALPNFPSVEKQRQLLYSHLKVLDPESETVLLLDDYELWWTSHADRDRPRLQEETVQQIVTKWCPVPKTTKEVLQMISGWHRQWFITSERAAELALTSAQREARSLHVHGPHGAGKTMLLVQRASSWLSRGCSVVVALGVDWHDLLLAELGHLVTRGQGAGVRNRLRLCRFDKEFLRALKELEGTRLNQTNPRSSRTFPKEYPVRRRKMRGPRSSCKSHRAESLTVATATGEAGPRPDQCHVQWWACRRVAEAMKSGVNFPGMQTREESAGTGLENTEEGPSWKRAKEETGGGLEEGKSKGDNATMTENRQEEKRTAVTKGEKKKEEKQEAEHKGVYVVIDELSRNDLALGMLTSVCKAMQVGTVKGIWTAHTSSLSSRAKEIVHRYGLEFEEVELEHSYRCPENVVDVLNAISEQDDSLWDPMEESCQVLKMADPVCTMVKPSKIPMPRCPSLRPSFFLHPEHKAFRCGLPFKKCPDCLLGLQSQLQELGLTSPDLSAREDDRHSLSMLKVIWTGRVVDGQDAEDLAAWFRRVGIPVVWEGCMVNVSRYFPVQTLESPGPIRPRRFLARCFSLVRGRRLYLRTLHRKPRRQASAMRNETPHTRMTQGSTKQDRAQVSAALSASPSIAAGESEDGTPRKRRTLPRETFCVLCERMITKTQKNHKARASSSAQHRERQSPRKESDPGILRTSSLEARLRCLCRRLPLRRSRGLTFGLQALLWRRGGWQRVRGRSQERAWRRRVAGGKCILGRAAVHMLSSIDFLGLESPVTLVVHHDWRDEWTEAKGDDSDDEDPPRIVLEDDGSKGGQIAAEDDTFPEHFRGRHDFPEETPEETTPTTGAEPKRSNDGELGSDDDKTAADEDSSGHRNTSKPLPRQESKLDTTRSRSEDSEKQFDKELRGGQDSTPAGDVSRDYKTKSEPHPQEGLQEDTPDDRCEDRMDEREVTVDDEPALRSGEPSWKRARRLADHRRGWYRAISRCQGKLLFLCATRSPALPRLQKAARL